MSSECKGCESYSYSEDRCRLGIKLKISNTEQCPCSICLIKSMCNGRVCDEFLEYEEKSRVLKKVWGRMEKSNE